MSTPTGPVTDDELKQLVLADVADTDGILLPQINVLWRLYSNWGAYASLNGLYSLQYLKVREHAIRIVRAPVRQKITYAEPDRRQQLKELFENLTEMLTETRDEIKAALDWIANKSGAEPDVQLTDIGKYPLDNPYFFPNPDDPRYMGVPQYGSLKDTP